jgi:hypothetical protein
MFPIAPINISFKLSNSSSKTCQRGENYLSILRRYFKTSTYGENQNPTSHNILEKGAGMKKISHDQNLLS